MYCNSDFITKMKTQYRVALRLEVISNNYYYIMISYMAWQIFYRNFIIHVTHVTEHVHAGGVWQCISIQPAHASCSYVLFPFMKSIEVMEQLLLLSCMHSFKANKIYSVIAIQLAIDDIGTTYDTGDKLVISYT